MLNYERHQNEVLGSTPSSRKINILVLIPNLEIGGVEMDLARNLPLLSRDEFEITVCCLFGRGPLAERLTADGVRIVGPLVPAESFRSTSPGSAADSEWPRGFQGAIAKWIKRGRALGRHLRATIALTPWLRRLRIDVLHAVLPVSYLVAVLARPFGHRPAVVMSRVSQNWYQGKIFRWIECYILHRFVDLVACNAGALRQELLAERLPPGKIRMIPNGINPVQFSPSEDPTFHRQRLGIAYGTLVFSIVANLHAYKGHADLLEALALAREDLPDSWQLLVAGRDIQGNLVKLRRRAEDLNLTSYVRWLGEYHDVAGMLSAADIHISASHTEGFPNNILEAMCIGRPVIATAVGGVPEMVVDGATGLLVPPRDPAALAQALCALATDSQRQADMGRAARELALSQYTIAHSVAGWEMAYRSAFVSKRKS